MNYLRLILTALGGVLVALVIYGSYQYYFKKPTPIVNNTVVEPGATMNVEQAKSVNSSGRLYTGLSGNQDTIMVQIGWLW